MRGKPDPSLNQNFVRSPFIDSGHYLQPQPLQNVRGILNSLKTAASELSTEFGREALPSEPTFTTSVTVTWCEFK